jgi:hypothetical protein
MAILHLRMHGPEHGSSAMKRFEYLGADLPHFSRGKIAFAESGNLPSFAEGNARDFWCAADEQERINARVFIEIEMALPYELSLSENEALAKQAAGDFFGTTFPYTMAIHWLLSSEKKRQYHLHMMFCSRGVTDATRDVPRERFFKRNGAKKEVVWNNRSRPFEMRVRWCGLLNGALASAGVDETLLPGKTEGAVEPKILRRGGLIDVDALWEVKDIRKGRRELAKLIAECEREAEVQIAAVEATLVENLRQLDALTVMQ